MGNFCERKAMKKEIIVVDKNGRVTLPEWAWKGLFRQSGSKAKSEVGIRRAVRKEFIKLLKEMGRK